MVVEVERRYQNKNHDTRGGSQYILRRKVVKGKPLNGTSGIDLLYKGEVDLFLKIISFVCCGRKEGDSPPYFQSQLLRVYNHRENGRDKESDQGAGN